MIDYRPIDLTHDAAARTRAAALLVAAFAEISPAWPDFHSAEAAISGYLGDGLVAYGAFAGTEMVGWIGALPQYDGHAWELHPLAVLPTAQRRGYGRGLVETLCAALSTRQAASLFVWCDDETGTTTLGGVSLFPDPLAALATLQSTARHAGGFYLRCGFALSGVIPDANGIGKHDFLYTKRISPQRG